MEEECWLTLAYLKMAEKTSNGVISLHERYAKQVGNKGKKHKHALQSVSM